MADEIQYGVTPQGFKRKRLATIKTDIESFLRAKIGNFINLLPSSLFGQFTGIFAERYDELWEVAEDTYNSQYSASATGVPLQNALALVGVPKQGAAKSLQQNLYLFGTPGTIIPVNTQVRVAGNTSAVFKLLESVQLVAGQDQIQRLSFGGVPDAGTYRLRYINEDTTLLNFDSSAADVQAALNALPKLEGVTVVGTPGTDFDITFGGLAGKTPHLPLVVMNNTMVDGVTPVTLAWVANLQEAIPQGVTDAEALTDGPTPAPLYSLTEIVNAVPGLDRVLNITDADVGRFLESDNDYRVRSTTAQAGVGRGSPDAIRARLLELDGVQRAIVFQNEEDFVDSLGLPPHSIRAYVQGGDDDEIFQEIWDSKGGGIKSDGLLVGTAYDDGGLPHTIKFSRPEIVPIYVEATISKNSNWPSNGISQVREALAAYVNSLEIGDDVIVYPKMIASTNGIAGITDIELKVGTAASPTTDDNIPIDIQELARIIDAGTDIVITVNP